MLVTIRKLTLLKFNAVAENNYEIAQRYHSKQTSVITAGFTNYYKLLTTGKLHDVNTTLLRGFSSLKKSLANQPYENTCYYCFDKAKLLNSNP